MPWDKIQFFAALLSLICLSLSYWYLSKKDKISSIDKGVITFFSVVILFCADRIKLSLWLICIGAIWIIRYKKKRNELT